VGWREWLQKLRRRSEPPLSGAPAIRRLKLYTALSGYVYQYYYEGRRAASRDHQMGTQYVFQVSGDRKAYAPVSVFLARAALAPWEADHHALNSTERYAIAKMALFQALDRWEHPRLAAHAEVRVTGEDVAGIMETLDLT